WVARYTGPENGGLDATAIAVDGLGTVYVTGRNSCEADRRGYVTVAYDTATGTQLWVACYNDPAKYHDRPRALAVDGFGGVYVTGSSHSTASRYDYATVAYDAATGAQRWVARYNGPFNGDDDAYAIAADGLGSVYVTGRSQMTPATMSTSRSRMTQ